MARGDHIYVQRAGGLYAHHGIDCGDGSVIHYSGEHWYSPRSVRHTAIDAFARGDEILVRDYAEFFARLRDTRSLPRRLHVQLAALLRGGRTQTSFSPGAVVERARSRLGEARFDIVLHNCEHFATWCKTGISDSEQIQALWRAALDRTSYRQWRRESVFSALLDRDASGPSGQ